MTPDDRERILLDLDYPPAWPAKLLGYLDKHHDLFLGWETKQGPVVSAQDYDKAIHGLRRVLQPYEILGWHCTRLTDDEADEIRRNGMQLPNAEMLARRIDAVVRTGEITSDIARRLKSENEAGAEYRAGMIAFCFYPPGNAGEDGIGRFFRHWGGEALYVCHENDPVTSPAISCIGTPCIVEAHIPIASLRQYGSLDLSIYRRYLFSRGDCIPRPSDYEDCIEHPLPAENVRRVIRFPGPDFYSLTECFEWRRPIRPTR